MPWGVDRSRGLTWLLLCTDQLVSVIRHMWKNLEGSFMHRTHTSALFRPPVYFRGVAHCCILVGACKFNACGKASGPFFYKAVIALHARENSSTSA
eukprot:scaffold50466_cov19-Tisochrysis_lutea.AAC.1